MSHAIPGLTGASTIPTPAFRLAQAVLGRVVDKGEIGIVNGPPGCGKTYAIEAFLDSPAMADRPSTYLEMPPRPAMKEVSVRLVAAVTGVRRPRGAEYELTEDLCAALHDTGHVVVIDEAHNLGATGLQKLRYLHQRGGFTWSLLLSGSRVLDAVKDTPELRSRTEGVVDFSPLQGAELLTALKAWHPMLASTPNQTLRYVDQHFGQGNLRNWAKFLRMCLDLSDPRTTDGVTDELTAAALAGLGADWR